MENPRDYVNPDAILAIVIVFPILGFAAVAARIYSHRLRKDRRNDFGIEGYLAMASWVGLLACSIDLGIGRSIKTVGYHSPVTTSRFEGPRIAQLDKIELAYNQMWIVSITTIKLTFLFFYRRLLGHGRAFVIANTTLIVLVIAWCICFFWLNLFECGRHLDQQWNPQKPPFANPQYCIDSTRVTFANSLTDCALDLAILIMPMPIVGRLHMAIRTRLAVMAIFALGGFCVVSSALRLTAYGALWTAHVHHKTTLTVLGTSGSDDYGVVSLLLFWSQIELGVAAIACNLPCIKPVFTQTRLNEFFSSIRSRTSLTSLRNRSPGNSARAGPARRGMDRDTELTAMPHGSKQSVTATAEQVQRSDSAVVDEHNVGVRTNISTYTERV